MGMIVSFFRLISFLQHSIKHQEEGETC